MPAIDAPFSKVSLQGRDLHCKLAAPWLFSAVDGRDGARFPHTPHPSFHPTPHFFPNSGLSEWATVLPGWLPRAGTHSEGFVLAERPGEGPGQGQEADSSDRL